VSAGGPARCPRCGGALAEALAACARCLLAGGSDAVLLGRYELGRELAADDLGAVYAARDAASGAMVRVRFLPEGDPPLPDAGRDEALRVLVSLRHPAIVAALAFGREGDEVFVVSEVPPGRPAAEAAPLAPDRALGVGLDICEALAAAHGRGIAHGALGPRRVVIDERGSARVVDLGIAPLLGAAPADPAAGDVAALARLIAALATSPPLPGPTPSTAHALRRAIALALVRLRLPPRSS